MKDHTDGRHLIDVEDKEQYLKDHYPFGDKPRMDEKVKCIHCGSIYAVRNYKVLRIPGHSMDYISCANAPRCTGSVIDWMRTEPVRLQKDIHKVFAKYEEFFSDKVYEVKGKKVKKKVKDLKHNREVTMRQYFKFIYDMDDTYVVVEDLYPEYIVPEEDKLELRSAMIKRLLSQQ